MRNSGQQPGMRAGDQLSREGCYGKRRVNQTQCSQISPRRERVSPTDGKEERPKYNHGITLLGRAFLTFPSVPFQNYKNGSDNILLGSCENLKLEM